MGPDDYAYPLPEAAIAQQPLADRTAARLLVDLGHGPTHHQVSDLPQFLGPGDLLVVNNTRVVPARLKLKKDSGGAVEVLLLEQHQETQWEALVKPSRRVAPGTVLHPGPGLTVTVGEDLGQGRRQITLDAPQGVMAALNKYGEMPLPPYLNTVLEEPDRYQTVYADRPASAAAPTAGLHLTKELLRQCQEAGAQIEELELVVGLDTFRPVMVDNLDDHHMHSEAFAVPEKTLDACHQARRVIAVGTTTVRALESAARQGNTGRTELFIRHPFDFQIVDLMLTNYHLPQSTLLVMLEAFIGPKWRNLYEIALDQNYRFLSFGDAMLIAKSQGENTK
ncbi:MAG TPA: tRNA preQ1(34) S-adenosylmethionine ribosyltransferase-isomerase QueA [Acidimicrobiia bacterium]|nr:tRNA preQ1(34) S-adenosylmethionine ribosyltransferase-isomerase QueA [Acidimicrobiia bacterium]HIL46708.1 tRNA preQ1(34) S-adenosylmethionine ribosyltransferase-isomerase QueA [Acidimicrobiia bacterium]